MEPTQADALKQLVNWGGQTIAFAMSLHAISQGKPIDGASRAIAANSEARKIREELWAASHAECKEPVALSEMTMRFSRRVLDWAADHRQGDNV